MTTPALLLRPKPRPSQRSHLELELCEHGIEAGAQIDPWLNRARCAACPTPGRAVAP